MMRRTAFLVITCLLLTGLALPSCTPGSGNEPLNLDPGGIVSGVDGVSVGAPEGALNQTIEIFIEKVDDPRREVPFPEYLADLEVVGDFYAINAEQDFSAPDEDYLLLGLPVPDGISTDDLSFVVLVPPDSIIVDQPDDSPSLRWIPLSGVYDPESGLFGTLLPSVLTEPQVFALVIGLRVDWTEGDLFCVVSSGFLANESPESHREITIDSLNTAHAAYVTEMGFREPDLRNHVVVIRFGWPPVASVHGYEYQLKKGAPNGFYDPATRTAGTYYPGAPDEPNPLTAPHELFHAIQFAYPALRANWPSWELRRTTEAAATAAELSLDELTRSNRPLAGRDPLSVTRGLWSSATVTSFDYAAQDFLVYLGRVIDPWDPQLEFMIPWFERGGLVADLDAVLQADPTFNSLGNAYWEWAKNHAFEKQVRLGSDSTNKTVPHGAACSWSGHGNLEHVSYSPEAWTWGNAATDFKLGPLTSKVFELTLNPGDDSYEVKATVDSADPDIEFKFYGGEESGGEGCWNCARDSVAHTFYVGEESVTGYLLVSNTNVGTVSGPISLETVVEFPDPNLEAVIREAIAKPTGPIYSSDMEGLTYLESGNETIADLTGLEHCINLTELYIGGKISDISPLANLTNLTELCLAGNQIGDISPLANLTNLTGLDLGANQISDISPLANLTNLTELCLFGNQIGDNISPLANLTNLTWLWLQETQLSNISPLANLTNLMVLLLQDNQISDISPLAGLTNLVDLFLRSNQISDIKPLVQNGGLGTGDWVDLWFNPLSSDSINIYIPQLEARGVGVGYQNLGS